MKINPNIEETLKEQYLQPGEDLEMMIWRVAKFIAEGEKQYGWSMERIEDLAEEYYSTISAGDWMPSSPFLMNAGTNVPMLFACFVLSIEDSMTSIFKTLGDAAMVHKMGGGTGFSFSRLRGRGAKIHSTGGTSSGVLSFLGIYNAESESVKQGGRRRAANMAVLRIDHPEIMDFINAKTDKSKFHEFNFSVLIPDWFMEKVAKGEDYDLVENDGTVVGKLNAKEVAELIVTNNWESGEPGVLFYDTINKNNKLAHLGDIDSTNPCGEQPLLPYEACDLASINLDTMVREDGTLNVAKLKSRVELIVRFLDTAIDVNVAPLPEIDAAIKRTRKIGLGIMGLHGYLIQRGLRYDSQEGRDEAEYVMALIDNYALTASIKLAQEKGVPSGWSGSDWERDNIIVRNLCRTTVAPTGTISMIANVSASGGEPMFAVVFARDVKGKRYVFINSLFEKIAKQEGWYSAQLIEEIIDNNGRVTGLKSVPEKWQNLFITAEEISPEAHVLMQAALQRHVDASISKTVNMPNDATVEDVAKIYTMAHDTGCKGITIYRAGSREGVLNIIKKEEPKPALDLIPMDPKALRPEMLLGMTTKVKSGCGKIWITINPFSGKIWEVFASSGAEGGCVASIQEVGRLASLLFREGVPADRIIDQLQSVKCPVAIGSKCGVKSCSDAIAKQIISALRIYDRIKPQWDLLQDQALAALHGEPISEIGNPDEPITIQAPIVEDKDAFLESINRMAGCRSGKCM